MTDMTDTNFGSGAFEVTPDQQDYAPGSTATFTASGFAAGDAISFSVQVIDPTTLTVLWSGPSWAVSDGSAEDLTDAADGVVQTHFAVTPDYANTTILLTATDLVTGEVATHVFTDAFSISYSDQNSTVVDVTTGNLAQLGQGALGSQGLFNNVFGTGLIQPFVRNETNDAQEEGRNSTATSAEYIKLSGNFVQNTDVNNATFAPIVALANLGTVIVNGTPYYEFLLDANQNSKSLISLDAVQIWQSTHNDLGTT